MSEKIELQCVAYMNPSCVAMDDVKNGGYTPALSHGKSEFLEGMGYVRMGNCTVTIELESQDAIVQAQIDALNKQLQQVRADAHVAENAILEKISKLQALTFDGGAV